MEYNQAHTYYKRYILDFSFSFIRTNAEMVSWIEAMPFFVSIFFPKIVLTDNIIAEGWKFFGINYNN